MIYVNLERANEIAKLFDKIRHILSDLETKDPQYLALEKLVENRGCNETVVLAICNSLVSYQLSIPGERYWSLFSEYFSIPSKKISIESFLDFMEKYNNKFLMNKMSRIRKFLSSTLAQRLKANGLEFCENPSLLHSNLLSELRADRYSKTIAFAIKMYTYVCNICRIKTDTFLDISIPLDRRNIIFSIISCLIKECGSINKCVNALSRGNKYRRVLIEAWNNICRSLGISCIKLDVFTWLFIGILEKEKFDPEKAVQLFKDKYGVEIPFEVVSEFSKCRESI